jgi:4,4'-diaponeurosporenoate glycosyltransferase
MLDATMVLMVCGWLLGWWAWGRPQRLEPGDLPTRRRPGRPSMSIIIPARDEARVLPLLLDDLARFRPAGSEVIVVDDESDDGTAAVAAAHDFVTVLSAGDRPAGWVGKAWACHVGVGSASAQTLCFLDADVRVAPGALEAAAARLAGDGGLVSVQPWHTTERPYEQASAFFGVVAMMGIGAGDRRGPEGAFGPVMVTDRADYDRVGGHTAIRGEIVEDLAMAEAYRRNGLGVSVYTGGDLFRFRMYPAGVRSLVQGWTKNFATGAADTHAPRLAAIVVWLSAMGTTLGVTWDAVAGSRPVAVAVAGVAAFTLQLWVMFRRVGRFGPGTAVLFPLWMATFLAIFARSLWCTVVRKEVAWRGRAVPLGTGRAT